MLQPITYIATTIPSFYHDVRTSPDIIARRDWTRGWWGIAPGRYLLVTSEAVLRELEGGIQEHAEARLGLVAGLPLLPIDPAITEIVAAYIRHQLMPADPTGDALHLALASYHKMRFLGDLELPSPGQCQQVRAYSSCQHDARALHAHHRNTSGTHGRHQCRRKK
jgi:hypothetical protein